MDKIRTLSASVQRLASLFIGTARRFASFLLALVPAFLVVVGVGIALSGVWFYEPRIALILGGSLLAYAAYNYERSRETL